MRWAAALALAAGRCSAQVFANESRCCFNQTGCGGCVGSTPACAASPDACWRCGGEWCPRCADSAAQPCHVVNSSGRCGSAGDDCPVTCGLCPPPAPVSTVPSPECAAAFAGYIRRYGSGSDGGVTVPGNRAGCVAGPVEGDAVPAADEAACLAAAANATRWADCTNDTSPRCFDQSSVYALWNGTCVLLPGPVDHTAVSPAGCPDGHALLLSVPLRCLWLPEDACRDPAEKKCVWTRVDGGDTCCVDGSNYNWGTYGGVDRLPTWVWILACLGACLLCVALLALLKKTEPTYFPSIPRLPDGGRVHLSEELVQQHRQDYDELLRELVTEIGAGDTMSSCSVCLETLEDTCVKLPGCGHTFHHECVRAYVAHQVEKKRRKHPECPNCRARIRLPKRREPKPDADYDPPSPESVSPGSVSPASAPDS